jgi:lysophospholipase L1-like esterase
MIFLYAGGNDINAHKTPEQVAADFRAFIEKVRAKLPAVPINYISIAGNPSRWKEVEQVKAANGLIEKICGEIPGLKYIDVYSHMLGEDGLPKPGIFLPDNLHMNAEGYKIWTGVIAPYLP